MSSSTIYGYLLEPEDFDHLQRINTVLFGDGTHLTPNRRRDLANLMAVVLRRAEPLDLKDLYPQGQEPP